MHAHARPSVRHSCCYIFCIILTSLPAGADSPLQSRLLLSLFARLLAVREERVPPPVSSGAPPPQFSPLPLLGAPPPLIAPWTSSFLSFLSSPGVQFNKVAHKLHVSNSRTSKQASTPFTGGVTGGKHTTHTLLSLSAHFTSARVR